MFSFKKKKNKEIRAFATGKLIAFEGVNDPVFSKKMMGDGFAIIPNDNTIYACADGEISMIFPSNHAFGLTTTDGLELLYHIGIDTVNENGEGFSRHVKEHVKVKAGDKIISFDRDALIAKGYDLTTMLVFTTNNYQNLAVEFDKEVNQLDEVIATYE